MGREFPRFGELRADPTNIQIENDEKVMRLSEFQESELLAFKNIQ